MLIWIFLISFLNWIRKFPRRFQLEKESPKFPLPFLSCLFSKLPSFYSSWAKRLPMNFTRKDLPILRPSLTSLNNPRYPSQNPRRTVRKRVPNNSPRQTTRTPAFASAKTKSSEFFCRKTADLVRIGFLRRFDIRKWERGQCSRKISSAFTEKPSNIPTPSILSSLLSYPLGCWKRTQVPYPKGIPPEPAYLQEADQPDRVPS